MPIARTLLAGVSALVALAGTAAAADYGVVYGDLLARAPEIKPVEIGNGWYLRGDATYDFSQDYDGSASLETPDGETGFDQDELDLDDGFGGGVGFGYRFSDYLRGDLTARYSHSDVGSFTDVSGNCGAFGEFCDIEADGKARGWELMANAYVDLGTFAGFTPYIGAGAGAVNVEYDDFSGTFCASEFTVDDEPGCGGFDLDGEDSWRFAYALQAGLAYNVNQSLTIDVGYRYLDVEGGSMVSGSLDGLDLDDTRFVTDDDGFQRHTVTAGLRYNLW